MKIMTVLGTRPEIIRLSQVIQQAGPPLRPRAGAHRPELRSRLSDIFFRELGVRPPDVHLGVRGPAFGEQVGQILAAYRAGPARRIARIGCLSWVTPTAAWRPSSQRGMGIPVYHMEAGNRCYDDRVPEEINRRIIDHVATF